MRISQLKFGLWIFIFLGGMVILPRTVARANEIIQPPDAGEAQQPTVAIATVTGTPSGPIAIVYADPEEQINVRSGPGTDYPRVGVLLNRQEVPALGRTPAGDWVEILYPGVDAGVAWVYAPLVRIIGDELPIVEPPPTPTPRVTPTIDPTLVAQFVVQVPATRMPTLTPPPPLVVPTFPPGNTTTGTGGVPIGFVIIGAAIFGVLGLGLSFLRRN